jgi:uncharacterized protein (TIRG00374 family)
MKKKGRLILQYVFFVALAGLFVWLSTKDLNAAKWKELKDALSRANYLLLIPVLLLMLLSHWVRALRWRMLIEPLGYTPSRINVFLGVMIGYFVNLGAPRLGEVVKCTVLARYEKVPAHKLIGTIVAERAFDMLCLLIAFGATFILEFDAISAMTTSKILPAFQGPDGQVSYSKIVILITSTILFFLLLKLFFSRFGHINLVQKLKTLLQGIAHGIGSIRYIRHKGVFLFQTVLIWILYLLSTWLGFFALKETSHLDLGQACAVLVMGSIGMIVSPGGIGAYAYLIQQTVVFFSIPETPYGLALGWLLWFGQFIIFVVFGVLSFILLPVVNKKKTHEQPGLSDAENI